MFGTTQPTKTQPAQSANQSNKDNLGNQGIEKHGPPDQTTQGTPHAEDYKGVRPVDQYTISGRFQNGKLFLTGPVQDFRDAAAVLTAAAAAGTKGAEHIHVQFDGLVQLPIKQSGNPSS